jgi:rhodanese-related sulfurtransferase
MLNISWFYKGMLLAFCFLLNSASAQSENDFDKMLNALCRKTVELVGAEKLIQMQPNQNLYLLDTRELEEYEVSHLPSAIFVGYTNFSIENLDNIPKDAIIVVYCSVGYRSELIGEQLLNHGFKKVLNLRGGVFDWVRKGFPVENAQGETVLKVHPYNKNWSKWVKNCEIAYE